MLHLTDFCGLYFPTLVSYLSKWYPFSGSWVHFSRDLHQATQLGVLDGSTRCVLG